MLKLLRSIPLKYHRPATLLWRYSGGQRRLFSLYIVLVVLGVLTESVGVFLLVPLLETMGKNNIFSNVALLGGISRLFDALPEETRLIWAGLIMLVVVLLRGAVQFAQEYIGYALPHRVDFKLRLKAFDALAGTSMKHVDSLGAGQISNFSVAHPARIGIALRFAAMMISNISVVLSYILVLGIVTPLLSLAAGTYLLLSTLLFKHLTTGWIHRVGRETSDANQRFSQLFYELLNGTKLIRLAGATDGVRRELGEVVDSLRRARDRTVAVENMTVPFFSVIGGLLICALVILVGLVGSQRASQAVGLLVIFVVLLFRILAPLSIINIARNNIIIHLDACEEYERLLREAEAAREPDGGIPSAGLRQSIRFERTSFAYGATQPPVLTEIDLDIPRGQMTAIVGPSGSGKSTLINLLTRLYRPTEGRILIDGQPLDRLEIATWWDRIAIVSQEVVLLNDTIRANLVLGLRRKITPEEQRQAARLAAIDDWIESLPEKYDTKLGDRGARLSGGQRQRLALARAFLRDPDLIVLDEATSALDTLTERAIQQEILALSGEKTIIVIAHRLSTVRSADQIIVLDHGRIVEQGSHEACMALRGMYWRMVQSQSLEPHDALPAAPSREPSGSKADL